LNHDYIKIYKLGFGWWSSSAAALLSFQKISSAVEGTPRTSTVVGELHVVFAIVSDRPLCGPDVSTSIVAAAAVVIAVAIVGRRRIPTSTATRSVGKVTERIAQIDWNLPPLSCPVVILAGIFTNVQHIDHHTLVTGKFAVDTNVTFLIVCSTIATTGRSNVHG